MAARRISTRAWAFGIVIATAEVAGLVALSPATSGEPTPRELAPTPSAIAAPSAVPSTPPRAPGPAAAPSPPRRVPPALPPKRATPWPWPYPAELDRATLSPERQARLADLEARTPNMPGYLDYTLGLVSRLHECMPDAAGEQGAVEITFHFALDTDSGIATGTQMELRDSTISEAADRRLRACADQAHRGYTLRLSRHGSGHRFYRGTRLRFPLEHNVTHWFGE